MKKVILLFVLFLTGCVVAGEFPEHRNRLHDMGHNEDYCAKNPDRCIDGVPW